jgi:large subunit ribosomal protein L21
MAYAIFKTGGKQYRVSEGDLIEVEKLDHPEGATATFSEVLLVTDGSAIKVGAETANASVEAKVVSQFKGEKVLAYQFRRRKGYHRTVGHRRQLTRLQITAIHG